MMFVLKNNLSNVHTHAFDCSPLLQKKEQMEMLSSEQQTNGDVFRMFTHNARISRTNRFVEALSDYQSLPTTSNPVVAEVVLANVAEQSRQLVDAHPDTVAALGAMRMCVRCRRLYKESENIGQWKCSYHIGRVNEMLGRYTCCDKPASHAAFGCRRCDHADLNAPHLLHYYPTTASGGGRHCALVPRFVTMYVLQPQRESIVSTEILDASWSVHDIRAASDVKGEREEALYRNYLRAKNTLYVARADYTLQQQ
jgi:hypothetical protein